jgi:RNA polymerase sigma factor (sigma-70 family)
VTVELEVGVRSGEVGDQPGAAFEGPEGFYRAHADALTKFATSLVGPSDAGDVVANAVAKTLAARDWSSIENPRAYVYRAVYREAMSWRRGAARRAVRHRADAERLAAIDRAVDDDVVPSGVADAVACLPDRQRAAVVLTYWDDRSIAEVAAVLGMSEGSVKKHLARARAALRAALPANGEEDD